MAARKNNKAVAEKALAMIKEGAKLKDVASACGFSQATAQYYKRKADGLKGAALSGKRRPASSSDADLIRRVNENYRFWSRMLSMMRSRP